jgi:hypothetical protein
VINGFNIGEHIEVAGVDSVRFVASTGNLALSSGSHVVDLLHLAGNYTGDTFAVQQSNGMGIISLSHN